MTRFAVVVLALGMAAPARAQDIPDFNSLRTPDSPALTLLGSSPTEIQRPSSVKQLALNIGSAFTGASGISVPTSYALEVSPFWLFSHSTLTIDNYVNANWGEKLYQDLSISLGTTASDPVAGSGLTTGTTYVSLGVRMPLLAQREKPTKACETALSSYNQALAKKLAELIGLEPNPASVSKDRVTQLESEAEAAVAPMWKDSVCVEETVAKLGPNLDLAGALAIALPGGDIESPDLSSGGVWLTFGYNWKQASLLVLGRFLSTDLETDAEQKFVDAGVRFIWASSVFATSLEFVYRRTLDAPSGADADLFRVDMGLDVKVADSMWVNLTFARDFAGSDVNQLLALANLKFDIGGRTITAQ